MSSRSPNKPIHQRQGRTVRRERSYRETRSMERVQSLSVSAFNRWIVPDEEDCQRDPLEDTIEAYLREEERLEQQQQYQELLPQPSTDDCLSRALFRPVHSPDDDNADSADDSDLFFLSSHEDKVEKPVKERIDFARLYKFAKEYCAAFETGAFGSRSKQQQQQGEEPDLSDMTSGREKHSHRPHHPPKQLQEPAHLDVRQQLEFNERPTFQQEPRKKLPQQEEQVEDEEYEGDKLQSTQSSSFSAPLLREGHVQARRPIEARIRSLLVNKSERQLTGHMPTQSSPSSPEKALLSSAAFRRRQARSNIPHVPREPTSPQTRVAGSMESPRLRNVTIQPAKDAFSDAANQYMCLCIQIKKLGHGLGLKNDERLSPRAMDASHVFRLVSRTLRYHVSSRQQRMSSGDNHPSLALFNEITPQFLRLTQLYAEQLAKLFEAGSSKNEYERMSATFANVVRGTAEVFHVLRVKNLTSSENEENHGLAANVTPRPPSTPSMTTFTSPKVPTSVKGKENLFSSLVHIQISVNELDTLLLQTGDQSRTTKKLGTLCKQISELSGKVGEFFD